MDSRTRVLRALSHQEPDRVPTDYWASSEVTTRLLSHYGFREKEELLRKFEVDFRYIDGPVYVGPPLVTKADGTREDAFGVPRRRVVHGAGEHAGTYSEVAYSPLETASTLDEIRQYPKWPKVEWFDYSVVWEQAKQARDAGKVVVFMGDRLNRCAQLKPAMYLRGMEQILLDLYMHEDIAKAVFGQIAEFYSEYLQRTLEAARGLIDIVFTGDDFGTQQNTFMPVDTWKKLLREGFKQFIDIGHKYDCKVAHHTCGSIITLIPDFIECGLDILNPLQPEATGMDFQTIKREFGKDLVFHGGISIQNTLPYGSPDEVRNEVRDRVLKLAEGGGYFFCTAHNLQTDTPRANIEALFNAYADLGRYKKE